MRLETLTVILECRRFRVCVWRLLTRIDHTDRHAKTAGDRFRRPSDLLNPLRLLRRRANRLILWPRANHRGLPAHPLPGCFNPIRRRLIDLAGINQEPAWTTAAAEKLSTCRLHFEPLPRRATASVERRQPDQGMP